MFSYGTFYVIFLTITLLAAIVLGTSADQGQSDHDLQCFAIPYYFMIIFPEEGQCYCPSGSLTHLF